MTRINVQGKATDPKKKKGAKVATKQQTLKQSVTAKHQSGSELPVETHP